MAPEVDPAFELACARLCPGFRATGPYLPARKSRVLPGDVGGVAVVAKQLARPNETWAWYLAREIAIYRAFAASPPAFRAPALVAADEASGLLVVEHLRGERLANLRHPAAELAPATLDAIVAAREAIAAWPGAFPADPPPPAVRRQLRARLLEDPTAPWVVPGLERAVATGILSATEQRRLEGALAGYPGEAASHGDLLLRNAILVDGAPLGATRASLVDGAHPVEATRASPATTAGLVDGMSPSDATRASPATTVGLVDGTRPLDAIATTVGLVDWECAGTHPLDWDLALVWTQLGPASRARLEAVACTSPARTAAFLALAAFALVREISFARSFARSRRESRSMRRLDGELRTTLARV